MCIPRSIRVVCLLMLALVTGCTPNAANTPESAAKSALRLLQAKDYEGLISQFVVPDELARAIEEEGSIEKVAEQTARVGDNIELMLTEAVKSTPQYSEDGSRAVFELSNDEVTFIKIGDRWYIED